ncbi:MAG: imidazole glycerol phosphate synthase subunit HisH, partial [Methanobacteriota archaeon]
MIIVDYGMGNLGSMLNMFKHVGVKAAIGSDPDKVRRAEKLVLPGVGAFDAGMDHINTRPGLREVLEEKVLKNGTPLLGVCLGMQLLTNGSEEGQLPGLGWIPGRAHRFPKKSGLKVPHMGWNVALPCRPNPLTKDLGE